MNITVPDQNTNTSEKSPVTFTVKAKTYIEPNTKGLRRRLLAKCADGWEARMVRIGGPLKSACDCPSACGQEMATCKAKASGTYTAITLKKAVCGSSPYDPTGAIVGGVIGGFFGLLLLLLDRKSVV